MRLAMALLATGMAVGIAWGQSPNIIDQTRQKLAAMQQQQSAASSEALAATQGQASTAPAAHAAPAASKSAGTAPAGNPSAPAAGAKKPLVTVVPMVPPKETGGKRTAKTKVAKASRTAKPAPAPTAATPGAESKKNEAKTISMSGHRDPFLSPVVGHINGDSGCSSGKRCLAVEQIALTGVVKSDGGMIAVVVNALNKAYFLRENDPVFNGYVVKITEDSILFKETVRDTLGKHITREVTKKMSVPAV